MKRKKMMKKCVKRDQKVAISTGFLALILIPMLCVGTRDDDLLLFTHGLNPQEHPFPIHPEQDEPID